MRRVFVLSMILLCVAVCGCTPPTDDAPASEPCAYGPQIRDTFGPAGDWAVRIAMRESGCNPDARNRSSGAVGLFQLLGHQDLINAVCLFDDGTNPDCNIDAAWLLYEGSGTRPWR